MEISRKTKPWKTVSEEDIDTAVDELGLLFSALSREQLGSAKRDCCMDNSMNQTGSCCCIHRLRLLKKSNNWDDRVDYLVICQEVSAWFCAAGELENRFVNKDIGPTRFREAFRRSIALRRSEKGVFTRMVDMSVLPDDYATSSAEDEDDEVLDVYENQVVSESTLCLNSVLHLWRKIAGGDFCRNSGTADFEEWQKRNYEAVLRWSAKLQEDVSTQVRKQRLFYSRIDDFLEAKGKRERVYFLRAQETFQANYQLPSTDKETEHWRKRQVNYWKRWNFASIHILQSNSEMLYNADTNRLANNLGMKITHVSQPTMSTLCELAEALERNSHKWRRVSKDKKLLYYPFENCHDVSSALKVHFGALGRGSKTEPVKKLLNDQDYMKRVKHADMELKELFLEMLNRGREQSSVYNEVAFQPSVLMSRIHHPQPAHWDYKEEGNQRENYFVAFLALTKTGQFLQVWEYEQHPKDETKKVEGEVVFIPQSEMVMVSGGVLHAGGFRAETRHDGREGHLRFHFYVYPGCKTCMVQKHTNVYKDSAEDLSVRYVQNKILAGSVGEGGAGNENLAWTFFQGKRPIDPSTGIEHKRQRTSRITQNV
jgi:hypothetical protein